jgi:hypothetical protein
MARSTSSTAAFCVLLALTIVCGAEARVLHGAHKKHAW